MHQLTDTREPKWLQKSGVEALQGKQQKTGGKWKKDESSEISRKSDSRKKKRMNECRKKRTCSCWVEGRRPPVAVGCVAPAGSFTGKRRWREASQERGVFCCVAVCVLFWVYWSIIQNSD